MTILDTVWCLVEQYEQNIKIFLYKSLFIIEIKNPIKRQFKKSKF